MKKCLICLSLLFSFFFIGSVKAFTTSDNQVFPDFPNNTQDYQYTIFTDSNGNYKLIEIPNGSLIVANNLRIMNNNLYIVLRNTKIYIIQNNTWVYDSSPTYNSYYGFTDIIASTVSIHQRNSNGGVDTSTYLYPAFYNFSSHTGFFDTVNADSWVYNQKFFDIVFDNLYTIKRYGSNPSTIINKEDYPYVAILSYKSSGYLYFKVLFSDCNNLDKSGNYFIAYKSCNYFYTQWSESISDKTHISGSFNGSLTPPKYTFTFDNTIVATNTDWYYDGTKKVSKNVDYSPSGIQSYTVNFHINGGNVIDLSNPLVPNYINLDYQIEITTEELEEYLGDITIYKDNNDFAGWYYDANFTEPYTPGDTLSSDIDLYAKWIPNPNITFHLNEGYIRIYDSESTNNNSGSSGGGHSSSGGRHEDQLITEDFSIRLPIDEINDYIESLIVNKSSMIFEGWYYDKNFNNPYHMGDNITVDTHLYAKYRYERVEDFLNNTTFTEYTFDTNYGYAIITRGSNSGDIYLGLNTNNYDITVYAYNGNLNTYSNEQGYCLTPIYSKDNKYYYLLNGDTTNYLNVLVLPKTTFENGNYNFLLTNNANITYTNNLEEVVIYDNNGNQITTDLSNTYNIFENSMINDEKDLIGIFKRLINFKDNKVFENINTIWNKLKATDLYIYFMILIVGTLIIMIIKGARRN